MNASNRRQACGLLLGVLFAFGCASPTGYQAFDSSGGYEDTRVKEDTFRVSFEGNQHTTMTRSQDFALLRSSELALSNGFGYFAVVDESQETRVETHVDPGSTTETTETTYSGGRDRGHGQRREKDCEKTVTTTTEYVPPHEYYLMKPRSWLTIRCFKDKPAAPETFDAAYLKQTLRAKYRLE